MFAFLVNISLRARLLVIVLFAGGMVYGGVSLTNLPIDVLPDLNKGLVTIVTEAPGLAPEEIEVQVSARIEAAMAGASGVTRVRSSSTTGLSIVFVEFGWDGNIYTDRQIVAERLAPVQLELPAGVRPIMAPISSYMGEIMLVAVSSSTLSPMDLRELADWTVGQRLKSVPGVSRIVPIGGLVKEYRVTLDMLRMSQLQVSIDQLRRALEAFGSNTGGGVVNQGDQEFLIRNVSRTQSLEDLRNIVVDHRLGQPVLLRQFAEVSFQPKQRRGSAGLEGSEAVVISVQKQPQADTVKLTHEIEQVLADLQRSMPPGTVVNEYLFRQSDFIHAAVGNLEQVLTEAIVAVAIILFLFLFNVRTTTISLVAIPVSVLTTFIVLRWLGLTINTMTLGGLAIAIGELVDDAVVDVENIFRRLRENAQKAVPLPSIEVIAAASQEVRSSIVYSTAIIVLVFVPLFALPGIEGRLFVPLGIAYIVSILASLVVSITLTPVLCSFLLPNTRGIDHQDNVLVRVLKRGNARLLHWVLGHPVPILSCILAAVVVAAAVVPTLPRSFLPRFNEGALVITMMLEPGISLDESSRIAATAEKLLQAVPEAVKVGRRTGRSEADEHALGVNVTELELELRRDMRALPAIMADVRERLGGLPGSFSISQPIALRIDHILTGVSAQVVMKIFGPDLDTLRTIGRDVEAWLKTIPGLADVNIERQVPVPQIQVHFDPDRALLYGVQPGELTQRIAQLTNGEEITEVIDGLKHFDLVVRLSEADRSTAQLGAMLIDTPAGQVPLSTIARVSETSGPNEILRENNQRRILVTANGDGTADNLVAGEIGDMMQNLKLPPGYFIVFEGVFAEQARSTLRLAGLSTISFLLVFSILYARFKSALLAGIIMANVPLALIGSVIALKISGVELSIAAIVGFVTLAGISTRNGILKINHYIHLMSHEGEVFGEKLIVRGANERLVPVLMTAASAVVALVPLLLGAHEPGKEILHPVAVVIFGGLMSATLLDTVLTPLLFQRFAPRVLDKLVETPDAHLKGAY
ncbi:efflux RND transporter permease subunit [Ancylobacter sp. TS-1]|uniref:efflux RND transporter permease subunit n=1 Tax=Ancylobacter sp. TS-1 TaxID=1850374 RepID=UPI001265ADA4|nr:efflux RND transporter permease subunit [Ancylobacter sp. TS-1]QFR32699.1 CusA/CzcA family heavy metal efflux RND transporter [Ancylobacter sp. TS-1]